MGCTLPKLQKAEERQSPGKIFSTLKRPQVETKVGVAYTYHFLDFLLGKEEVPVSSVLCLSSVRELPVQVRELYGQGFVLVAVHPFVHPCGPRHARIQRQLHRAVLVRETPSSEKSQLKWAGRRLETDVCMAGHQAPDPEVIHNYVKKVQDMAEQGVLFLGFLQQPGGGPCFQGHWDPEELSSLHSSPSPIHRHPASTSTSPTEPTKPNQDLQEPQDLGDPPTEPISLDPFKQGEPAMGSSDPVPPGVGNPSRSCLKGLTDLSRQTDADPQAQNHDHREPCRDQQCLDPPETTSLALPLQPAGARWRVNPKLQPNGERESPGPGVGSPGTGRRTGSQPETPPHGDDTVGTGDRSGDLEEPHRHSGGTTHNNNHFQSRSSEREKKTATSPPTQTRTQLFALYNHSGELCRSVRFYSLRVPLRIQREAGLATEIDAQWLDHMTQHFTSGARLVDGFFHTGDHNDSGVSAVDSVFIFQSSSEEATPTSYDAIVVEQWTIVDGVVVRTDYVPLLQSLAPYGWRLMCVLPTPVVRTNGDGSLSTKQILFLQRPTLQRRRKDFKRLNLRGRYKARKNSAKEAPGKAVERENASPMTERGMDRPRVNTEEEEREARKNGVKREMEGESPRRDEKESASETEHQKDFAFQEEGGAPDAHQGEGTEIGSIQLVKREKTVRWTDVCQIEDEKGMVLKEGRTDEKVTQQLCEKALFSGVC
ncbi:raftlin [Aplochiton taeniatus]